MITSTMLLAVSLPATIICGAILAFHFYYLSMKDVKNENCWVASAFFFSLITAISANVAFYTILFKVYEHFSNR